MQSIQLLSTNLLAIIETKEFVRIFESFFHASFTHSKTEYVANIIRSLIGFSDTCVKVRLVNCSGGKTGCLFI